MTRRNEVATLEPVPIELMDMMDVMEQQRAARASKRSEEERLRDAVTELLGRLGGLQVQEDALTFEGTKFVLPAQYAGKVDQAINFLRDWIKQNDQKFNFHQDYPYRPYDGAYAFDRVMRTLFGTTGMGRTQYGLFGTEILPEFISVETAPGEHTQVPWGSVSFPPYDATFELSAVDTPESGVIFRLEVAAPRKWRKHIQAMFNMVDEALQRDSLYRGKAITGEMYPTLIDPFTTDTERIVYSADVVAALEAELWVLLTHSADMRRLGVPLKRRVLLAGPYGTGKTLAGMWTAQKAVTNGWTFIQCRPGKDDPEVVLRTAQLYAPAVVLIEDVEVIAGQQRSSAELSRLLDMLDGMGSKGKEIVAIFTTNHLDKIQKGALRPGRIDSIIEITKLDEAAFRKLITVTLPDGLLSGDIDWTAVAEAYDGYLPAFAVEAVQRATRYTFARTGVVEQVSTEDLIHAAKSLRPQWSLMQEAPEGVNRAGLDDRIRDIVTDVQERTSVDASRSGKLPLIVRAPSQVVVNSSN